MKVAIIGAGRLGLSIVETLVGGGNEITLIDTDEKRVNDASSQYDVFTMCADARDIDVLNSLPVKEYDLAIAATSNDEINITIASFAKKLGCPKVMARIRDPRYSGKEKNIRDFMGIDYILNPDMACAEEIVKYLTEKYSIEGGRFTIGGATVLELPISKIPQLVQLQIKDASSVLDGLLIVAVARDGKIMIPNGNTTLIDEDVLYVLGQAKRISAIAPQMEADTKKSDVKRVMIAGGGKTGYYLAKLLSKRNLGVKIIEKDRARAEFLSGELDTALILNGDATDTNLLQEENMDSMDAFVAITGFDEQNLLLSMIAQQHGVEEIVAKVSTKAYMPLMEKMGVAMTINPMDMCAASVMHTIRKQGIVTGNKLINGQAEFVEFKAESTMAFTGKPLSELNIPEGIIIAAVRRSNELIIPKGNTKIMPGDIVTVLCLLSSSAALEGIISGTKASVL